VHVRLVRRGVGEHEGGGSLLDPGPPQVLGTRRVTANEIDVAARRVLLDVSEDDDLRFVLVAAELLDELAGGRVPAADDDMVPIPRSPKP